MTQFVALFRGINVGGKNIVPMKDLRQVLTGLDCGSVSTCIQSGNAVFSSESNDEDLSGSIAGATKKHFGFEPQVLVLTADRFREIAAANPYRDVESDDRFIHVWFLADVPGEPDLAAISELRSPTEEFKLGDGAFYLHAPDGIARSKLAARAERHLGVAATARNLRTVSKLLDMLNQ
jgi:uncharacterized protein (DUF1697 family)